MSVTTIHDKILFTFEDEHGAGGFNNVSEGGIVFSSFHHDVREPRWGVVLVVGPDVKDVSVGDRILIEPLKWSEGHDVDGLKIWMTEESQVMVVESNG
jgi:co-chaperonin GroES (HSP10)